MLKRTDRMDSERNADNPSRVNPAGLIMMLFSVAAAALAAAIVLPVWLPGLYASLLGEEPKAFWYLARASGVVAYLLLWLAMVAGLLVSNKLARLWNGGPQTVDLHQYVTWLAIAFSVFHALILVGDRYIRATVPQVLTPFAYAEYNPFWVGVGQLMFYAALIIAVSYYFRKRMGYRVWRALHYASFVLYLGLTLHGIFAGTDTTVPLMLVIYIATGVSICLLTIVRIVEALRASRSTGNVSSRRSSPPSVAR